MSQPSQDFTLSKSAAMCAPDSACGHADFAPPVLVLGGGRSGIAVHNLLTEQHIPHELCPDTRLLGAEMLDDTLKKFASIITSPVISEDNPVLVRARELGLKIVAELEYAFRCLRCPVIAVTGTNGKTTTTSLLGHILTRSGKNAYTAGNIGLPLSAIVSAALPCDVAAVEVSSFQLMGVETFAPHIAAILNISPDHLDRHGTMERYIEAKTRIFAAQTDGDFLLLNADDPVTARMGENARSRVYYFSTQTRVDGAYIEDGCIKVFDTTVMPVDKIPLIGVHNLSNTLAAVLAAHLAGVPAMTIAAAVAAECAVAHRLQQIAVSGSTRFFNDSKATNVDSTLTALRAFSKPFVLILGGSDKGTEFDGLFEAIKANPYVQKAVITGATAQRLLEAAARQGCGDRVEVAANFESAVRFASKTALKSGADVLLSPACASFDEFADYEHRGAAFVKLAKQILASAAISRGDTADA